MNLKCFLSLFFYWFDEKLCKLNLKNICLQKKEMELQSENDSLKSQLEQLLNSKAELIKEIESTKVEVSDSQQNNSALESGESENDLEKKELIESLTIKETQIKV